MESCGIEVFEFVLEDDALVEQTLLNHIVRGLDFFRSLGNLLQVVFLVVRVFGPFERLFVYLGAVVGDRVASLSEFVFVFLVFSVLVEREDGLVAAAPVIFEFTVAPLLLEGGLAGILGGSVVEVPGVVVVHLVGCGGVGFSVVIVGVAFGLLLSQVFLSCGILGLFFLLLLQVLDDFFDDFLLLFKRQLRQAQQ